MHTYSKSSYWPAALLAVSLTLAGCGGSGGGTSTTGASAPEPAPFVQTQVDVSNAGIVSAATKNSGGVITSTSTDFSFPEMSAANGSLTMTIPSGPAPAMPARRTIASGGGNKLGFGDPVILQFDMFSWNEGKLVESSSQYDEAYTVKSGISDDVPIPEYLAKSLLGRSLGDTVQIVLPVGTEDLPSYLDKDDAHILVVKLL